MHRARQTRAGAGRTRREGPAGRHALGALQALAQGKAREAQGRRRGERLEKCGRQFQTSEGIAQAITYMGYALVGVLVMFVIWSELRAAGFFGGARRARRARTAAAAQWRRRLCSSDVAAAPLADRPGMLLRLLGEALTRAERLPAAEGLTAAAIVRRAQPRFGAGARRARASGHHGGHGSLRPQHSARRQTRGHGGRGQGAAREIRTPRGRQTLMRERGITFLLALAALAAFYGLWLRPAPSLDPDADTARPTTAERRGNGYAGLFEWLQSSGVDSALLPRALFAAAGSRCTAARQPADSLAACASRYSTATSSARSTSGFGAATRCSSMPR